MKLPKELTTVTPLSKAVALIMFISLPILGFLYGKNYQKSIQETPIIQKNDSELFNPTPSISPTSATFSSDKWRIFNDEKLNISFEYPQEWKEPTITQLSTKTIIEFRDGQETPDNTISPKLTISLGTAYSQTLKRELILAEYIEQFIPQDYKPEQYERIEDYNSPYGYPQLVGKIYTHTSRAGMGNWITDAYLAQNMNAPIITTLSFRYDSIRGPDEKAPPLDLILEHILSTLRVSTYRGK